MLRLREGRVHVLNLQSALLVGLAFAQLLFQRLLELREVMGGFEDFL
jgi:hypothetical protein